MKKQEVKSLKVYPENRDAIHPTTSKIFDIFKPVSTYSIISNEDVIESYRDDLNPVQHLILELLNIDKGQYWENERINKMI